MGRLRVRYPENPVELEQALGLNRGDILEVECEAGRIVRVTFSPAVTLPDSALENRLQRLVGGLVEVE